MFFYLWLSCLLTHSGKFKKGARNGLVTLVNIYPITEGAGLTSELGLWRTVTRTIPPSWNEICMQSSFGAWKELEGNKGLKLYISAVNVLSCLQNLTRILGVLFCSYVFHKDKYPWSFNIFIRFRQGVEYGAIFFFNCWSLFFNAYFWRNSSEIKTQVNQRDRESDFL